MCRGSRKSTSNFHLGVDGISLAMVLLTGILTPLGVLISFRIKERVPLYMMLFLLLETGLMGVFMSLDLIIFFIFWEIGLVPMYFLINQWGSANAVCSFKFFIYTMAGSVGLLLSIQLIWSALGTYRHLKSRRGLADLLGALGVGRAIGDRQGHRLLGVRRSRLRSKCRSGRSTRGCPMRTRKRPPPDRCCWQVCC